MDCPNRYVSFRHLAIAERGLSDRDLPRYRQPMPRFRCDELIAAFCVHWEYRCGGSEVLAPSEASLIARRAGAIALPANGVRASIWLALRDPLGR
jgi:hypothetical protein